MSPVPLGIEASTVTGQTVLADSSAPAGFLVDVRDAQFDRSVQGIVVDATASDLPQGQALSGLGAPSGPAGNAAPVLDNRGVASDGFDYDAQQRFWGRLLDAHKVDMQRVLWNGDTFQVRYDESHWVSYALSEGTHGTLVVQEYSQLSGGRVRIETTVYNADGTRQTHVDVHRSDLVFTLRDSPQPAQPGDVVIDGVTYQQSSWTEASKPKPEQPASNPSQPAAATQQPSTQSSDKDQTKKDQQADGGPKQEPADKPTSSEKPPPKADGETKKPTTSQPGAEGGGSPHDGPGRPLPSRDSQAIDLPEPPHRQLVGQPGPDTNDRSAWRRRPKAPRIEAPPSAVKGFVWTPPRPQVGSGLASQPFEPQSFLDAARDLRTIDELVQSLLDPVVNPIPTP